MITSAKPQILTPDGRSVVPTGCYTLPLANCGQTSKLSKITTSEEYSRALQLDTEVSGQYEVGAKGSKGVMSAEVSKKYSFKASRGYSSFKKNVEERMAERFELKSYCLHYEVGYGDDYVRVPTASSLAACKKLKNTTGLTGTQVRDQWFAFFATYGTHYMSRVRLGGKMVYTMDVEDFKRTKDEKEKISTSFAMSYAMEKKVSAGLRASVSGSFPGARGGGGLYLYEATLATVRAVESISGDPVGVYCHRQDAAKKKTTTQKPLGFIGNHKKNLARQVLCLQVSTGGMSSLVWYATPPPPPPCPPCPLSYQRSIATGHIYGGAEGARFFFHSHCPHANPRWSVDGRHPLAHMAPLPALTLALTLALALTLTLTPALSRLNIGTELVGEGTSAMTGEGHQE